MTMDRTIFDMNLSVEATSLYILICSNTAGNQGPTLETLLSIWNGSDEQMKTAADELTRRGILLTPPPIAATEPLKVSNSHCWTQSS